MKRTMMTVCGLLTLVAGAVDSSNIHGVLRVDSATTNTLIAIPWRGYAEFNDDRYDLLADRLVKPRNLTLGDELLLLDATGSQTFASWTLQDVGKDGVRWSWVPGTTVRRREDGSSAVFVADAGTPVKRGYGLWLVRQNPVDADGKARPFYLHGQWTSGPQDVSVFGISEGMRGIRGYDVAGYTMLANPDCTHETDLNGDLEWDWSRIGTNDTVVISNDRNAAEYCFRREIRRGADKGKFSSRWYKAVVSGSEGGGTTTYTDVIKVPPGTGFWYVRREPGDLTVRWKVR